MDDLNTRLAGLEERPTTLPDNSSLVHPALQWAAGIGIVAIVGILAYGLLFGGQSGNAANSALNQQQALNQGGGQAGPRGGNVRQASLGRSSGGAGALAHDAEVEKDFRANCEDEKGTVYSAEDWNSRRPGANLPRGALHCHRPARWVVDTKE